MKGESLDEIEGAVRVMRELCTPVVLASQHHVVDIVGTGGDGANLFNVSMLRRLLWPPQGQLSPSMVIAPCPLKVAVPMF